MQRLFLFLYRYRAFLTFLLLEVVCIWMVVTYNRYQGAAFFNSSSTAVAAIISVSDNVSNYFSLAQSNRTLAEENALLRTQISRLGTGGILPELEVIVPSDTTRQYEYIPARVVNNTVRLFKNHITINRGSNHGIEPGMGAVSSSGVIGKVKTVSANFSVITSLLHNDVMVSSNVKRTGDLATTRWNGIAPHKAQLHYLPRHTTPMIGDTIVTSGYNAIFPEGIIIGVIAETSLTENDVFHNIEMDLSNDFNKIGFVYVIKNALKLEQVELESEIE